MDNTSKIKCRKCNGNHLTIKCGKSENKVEESTEIIKNKPKYETKSYEKRSYTVNKVKIGSLPIDMTQEELSELLYNWGNVSSIRVLNYPESSTAYVEFRDSKEVDYLIEALHKTPFDHLIITVEKLDQ